MLIYPPGELYQRGEDRCQINVEASSSNAMRSCNDLGYIASNLDFNKFKVLLKDYASEKESFACFISDIKSFDPDLIFISTSNGSLYNDINIINILKVIKNDIIIILKGALFFNAQENFLNSLNLDSADYLIMAESEFIAPELINAIFFDKDKIPSIQGICHKKDNLWQVNNLTEFNENLDSLKFPERSLMNNKLYLNPLTNKPMATIVTAKGCPYDCIYCLSPVIGGKKIRKRTPDSVFDEIWECFHLYNISDFFFKSDTFTADKNFVKELCEKIINSTLNGKINWVANSRADTIDEDTIRLMKKAGCSLIALGIESGNDESLQLMHKNTTVEQNINAVNLIKKYDIKIFGFYMIGFDWETEKHLEDTKKLIFDLDTDFIEISIVTPFQGTSIYKDSKVVGKDAFGCTVNNKLNNYRKKILLEYHLRPSYILKKLKDKNLKPQILINYIKYGLRLIKNCLK